MILDNTDQYSPEVQDYCFTLAQQIASLVDGLVIISMREERFHESRLHGTLDAFQNTGFHLSSPPSKQVFSLRLDYMRRVLDDITTARHASPSMTDEKRIAVRDLLGTLHYEFERPASHLSKFLRACSHGNMRLALEMFRQFLVSGYTNVGELIEIPDFTLQVHQVLRPMMIPTRFFYSEKLSSIPNLYQLRSESASSHFTGLRILDVLTKNISPVNPVFISISRLKGLFSSKFKMPEDLLSNLDIMLRTGILEANNRLDYYSEAVDSVRITPYGYYMRDTMAKLFTYLDLVCIDCSIHEESVAHSLSRFASNEVELFVENRTLERIQLRFDRTEEFVNYLVREADRERDMLGLEPYDVRYAAEIKQSFIEERVRVKASAERYARKQASARND